MRTEMGTAAVKAANTIGYENAGTFEFIVDAERNYYFLEMNTRLQVEHPITEEITGLDLVEQQIRIASGEALAFSQEDIEMNGHAIEVRVYAEDPKTFFPSPGKITALSLPQGDYIRNDSGIKAGSNITPFYDGMFAKLIVTGATRSECIEHALQAVGQYEVEGVKTNLSMIEKVLSHEEFQKGNTTTSFVERHYK